MRRLAALYPDTVIAGILNRQGRTTARGHRFEANRVATLRTHWRIGLTGDYVWTDANPAAPFWRRRSRRPCDGFITMQEATRALGVTRQTVLQRVKRGEIEAAHVTKGGKRGLRIKVIEHQPTLFSHL